jgi:hypothetical protein
MLRPSPAGFIEDSVFAAPLPVEALVVAGKAHDAMALGSPRTSASLMALRTREHGPCQGIAV